MSEQQWAIAIFIILWVLILGLVLAKLSGHL